MPYRPIGSPFGEIWLHHCPALAHGPEWARRERMLVDAGAINSRLKFRGRSMPFHGHLFRQKNGLFRFSERDRAKYPAGLLDELEDAVNKGVGKMSQGSSPFTVDPQTLLHLKAALVDFRLRTPACPECGGDVEDKPKHDAACSFGRAVHLVDYLLSDEYHEVFTRARLRREARGHATPTTVPR